MGILPRLRDAHIDLRRLTFLGGDGGEVAAVHPHTVTGGVGGRDLEVRRGDLTDALHAAVRDDVEFLFNDSIDSIDTFDQSGHGVDVTFRGGGRRTFDMLFGADGAHSRTREMLFGPEERFHRYLGHRFAVFTMHNTFGLSHETVMWNTPGRAAALYAVGDNDDVHAFLNFAHPEPPSDAFPDPKAQRDLIAEVFADAGWEVPGMLAAMRDADDVFFDAVGQIRMPRWSSGRVALVGDAAYAPSFLTGQGTSLALVGAYMLAASLADRDHTAGFAAYEQGTRAFRDREPGPGRRGRSHPLPDHRRGPGAAQRQAPQSPHHPRHGGPPGPTGPCGPHPARTHPHDMSPTPPPKHCQRQASLTSGIVDDRHDRRQPAAGPPAADDCPPPKVQSGPVCTVRT